jgi:hypothetical protein
VLLLFIIYFSFSWISMKFELFCILFKVLLVLVINFLFCIQVCPSRLVGVGCSVGMWHEGDGKGSCYLWYNKKVHI